MRQTTKYVYVQCDQLKDTCRNQKARINTISQGKKQVDNRYRQLHSYLDMIARYAETAAAKQKIIETEIFINHYHLLDIEQV